MGEAAMQRAPFALRGPLEPGAQRDEEREEMLFPRMDEARLRPEGLVIHQGLGIARGDAVRKPVIESDGPIRRLPIVDLELAQIVDRPAAGEDQHAFIAQRRQLAPELDVMRRTGGKLYRE